MPFPPAHRVLYRKKPLEEVICQLRFPPILRIDTDLPADFQDKVRADFPNFTQAADFRLEVPPAMEAQVPLEIMRQIVQSTSGSGKNYAFSSADGSWRINLTRTFLAVSTTAYERWEEFRNRLMLPYQALNSTYSPNYFSRVGLRYVDVIRRSRVGLPNVPWSDLVSPALIGMLGSPDTAEFIDSFQSVQELRLSEQPGKARITAKLVQAKEDKEICLAIDSDFFDASRIEIGVAIDRLSFFNSRASRFIRWAITERLHEAMEPQPL